MNRLTWFLLLTTVAAAQSRDPGVSLAESVSENTAGKLKLNFEFRGRYESRTGNSFGAAPDLATGLFRTRVGLSFIPVKWLKFSGMMQDSRSPWYGRNAPNTVRDPADLQEAYIELFPGYQRGFGMTAGRMMLNYGDGRLIGTPQWGNLARTYDQARLYYRLPRARFELLFTSVVKIRIGEFNRPVLGDRVWGTYNSFPNIYRKNLLDVYLLRREQNRPAGFTGGSQQAGTDKLGINTFGLRATGPLAPALKYTVEVAAQAGRSGPSELRAQALVVTLARRWNPGKKPLDVSGEYKFASGNHNPSDLTRTGAFDQLYAANHDRFGHEDLFGWRNLHNPRSVATLGIGKGLALNLMYNGFWLAAVKDGIYNAACSKAIAQSKTGRDGRHVGEETDLFATYQYHHFTLGAGYGRFFAGDFIRRTTPGVGPNYIYIFHTYSF